MKFMDLAQEYVDLNVFNPDTKITLLRAVRLFVTRAGVEYCHEIDREQVIRFKTETLSRAETVTYNGYLRYLRLVGDYAVDQNFLERNVFRQAKTAPAGTKLPKTQPLENVIEALQHLERGRYNYDPVWFWQAVIKCLYYTGIRRRQLTNIVAGDLNLKAGTLKLSYEGSKTHREWFIPIHSEIRSTFVQVLEELKIALGRPVRPTDALFNMVFLSKKYRHDERRPDALRPRALTDFFKRIKKNSGIRVSAHRFRHSLATEMCNPPDGEADVLSAQSMLGHTSLQTTRIYVRTSVRQMGHALDKIPKLRESGSEGVSPMPL